jgi:phosphatidate cytidylyltransferase
MKTRVITGALLLAFFIPMFIIGGWILDVVLILCTFIATWEFSRMFNKEKNNYVVLGFQLLFSAGLFLAIKLFLLEEIHVDVVFALVFFFVIVGAMFLVFIEDFGANEFGNMFVSVYYPVFGFVSIAFLRALPDGLLIIGFLFMVTAMTDTFAYIFGVRFGKHRLAVKISPKKSIEGSVYGTLSAIVLTIGYILLTDLQAIGSIEMSILVSIILILVISIVGQIGDLSASKMKRDYDIKDYSNLFPGHGGIMDRFDSVTLAAMVLLFIVMVVDVL